MTEAQERAAQGWYGCGRWDAPYWFVGMNQGGEGDDGRYDAWIDMGGRELIDCRAHHLHRLRQATTWFRALRPRIQPTCGKLIRLLLAFKHELSCSDEARNREAVRRYQPPLSI